MEVKRHCGAPEEGNGGPKQMRHKKKGKFGIVEGSKKRLPRYNGRATTIKWRHNRRIEDVNALKKGALVSKK